MKATSRRTLGIGGLILVVLLGIGLWPRHVLVARGDVASDIAEAQAWTASADCSILLGEYRVETYRKPPDAVLPDGAVCGSNSGPRNALIVVLVLTLTVTFVLVVWTLVTIPDDELDDDESGSDDPS